jgi:hypothetical protein
MDKRKRRKLVAGQLGWTAEPPGGMPCFGHISTTMPPLNFLRK